MDHTLLVHWEAVGCDRPHYHEDELWPFVLRRIAGGQGEESLSFEEFFKDSSHVHLASSGTFFSTVAFHPCIMRGTQANLVVASFPGSPLRSLPWRGLGERQVGEYRAGRGRRGESYGRSVVSHRLVRGLALSTCMSLGTITTSPRIITLSLHSSPSPTPHVATRSSFDVDKTIRSVSSTQICVPSSPEGYSSKSEVSLDVAVSIHEVVLRPVWSSTRCKIFACWCSQEIRFTLLLVRQSIGQGWAQSTVSWRKPFPYSRPS